VKTSVICPDTAPAATAVSKDDWSSPIASVETGMAGVGYAGPPMFIVHARIASTKVKTQTRMDILRVFILPLKDYNRKWKFTNIFNGGPFIWSILTLHTKTLGVIIA
jgi:hypothetical protein